MLTSACGTTDRRGFTLVEIAVVLFIIGLILWTVAPRMSRLGDPGRDAVFRDLASASEQAFDASLFEKRETRLVLIPSSRTYEFLDPSRQFDERRPMEFGADLTITAILIGGEQRPLDLPTEIRYQPGGRVPEAEIHFQDTSDKKKPTKWILSLNQVDGAIEIMEDTGR